jgi:hypothetical protein
MQLPATSGRLVASYIRRRMRRFSQDTTEGKRMRKLLAPAVLAIAVLALPPAAWAAAGGDPNAGDVWVDNVGQPAGPGHEMDPHLACQDINLWGSGLADASGRFTIDGWSPSGAGRLDYGATTWAYRSRAAGSQVIAVIDVHALIAQAVANGETPLATEGYHFKLQFSQDPQKHKTFWVNCTPPTPTPAPPPASSPPPPTSPSPAPPASASPKPPPASAPAGAPATATPPRAPAHRAHRRVARHHRKRHRPRRRHVAPRPRPPRRPVPSFTG